MLDPILTQPWQCLSAWFQSDALRTPLEGRRLVTSVMINECKGRVYQGLGSLVDVGGRAGTVAKAKAKASQQ
ncbi:hypothetical protein NC652_011775 [Populus alba x Populus x berolinensis]|nr:hypothetical protein NC652_011775 [Populus alba x Populus x berolinensis]